MPIKVGGWWSLKIFAENKLLQQILQEFCVDLKGPSLNSWPKFISSVIATFGHCFGNLATTLIAATLKLYDIPLGRALSFALEKKLALLSSLLLHYLQRRKFIPEPQAVISL